MATDAITVTAEELNNSESEEDIGYTGLPYVVLTKDDLMMYVEIPEDIRMELLEEKSDGTQGILHQFHHYILKKMHDSMVRHKDHSDKIMARSGYNVSEYVPDINYLKEYWFDFNTFLYSEFAFIQHITGEKLKASKFAINMVREYLEKVKDWDFEANKGEWPKVTKE